MKPADSPLESVLVTPLHQAVYRVLIEAGFTEGNEVRGTESAPIAMACILTSALHAYPTEDQLLDAMTWGQGQEHWDELRPLARRLLALAESDASPA